MGVMTDARIDPDRLMLAGVDMNPKQSKKPLVFTVSEMAKFFFARSKHWVRWQEQHGKMIYTDPETGETRPVGIARTETTSGRVYNLADVEEIAHGLAQQGVISGTQLRHTLHLVKVRAQMEGYL